MRIKITHDVFNIAKRIKQINKNYFIMFNTKSENFEVHNKSYKNTFCLCLPFKNLDSRVITYVLKSEKVEECFEEIEKNNSKLEKSKQNKIKDMVNYQLKEIYDYANKKATDFNGNAFKTNWL